MKRHVNINGEDVGSQTGRTHSIANNITKYNEIKTFDMDVLPNRIEHLPQAQLGLCVIPATIILKLQTSHTNSGYTSH
jgi:hypothetical protein